jgi:hypothetical protein
MLHDLGQPSGVGLTEDAPGIACLPFAASVFGQWVLKSVEPSDAAGKFALPEAATGVAPDDKPVIELVRRVAESNDSSDLEACYAAVSATLKQTGLPMPTGPLNTADLPKPFLRERERILGPATLAADALELLFHLAEGSAGESPAYIVHHAPSFSAAHKQVALSLVCDAVVHKTVTLRIGDHLVFCTGPGDFNIDRPTLRVIGRGLSLSRKEQSRVSINPDDVVPETAFGQLRGIVSPFLSRIPNVRLASIFLLPYAPDDVGSDVAIPISPCESLIVSAEAFAPIVKSFVAHRLPVMSVRLVTTWEPDTSTSKT